MRTEIRKDLMGNTDFCLDLTDEQNLGNGKHVIKFVLYALNLKL